jgi:hypothetical protein
VSEGGDYVFRYPLVTGGHDPVYHDPLVEMIRVLLESLLDVVVLTYGGKEVKADGFRLLTRPEEEFRIFGPRPSLDGQERPNLQSVRNAALYEPRIVLIERALAAILSVVELEGEEGPVSVSGFRLRDPRHWLMPSAGDPLEVFGYAATRCNVDCSFCYLKGDPPDLALVSPRRKAADELAEMMTRLRYFDPEAGRALFPAWGEIREALAYPHILTILKALRQKTLRPFRIYTSGRALTREMVKELAALGPLYIYLSLHSASPDRLSRLVHRARPEVQLAAPRLLQEYGIPYAIALVPWPQDGLAPMLEDLQETISHFDQYQPHLFQVHLPGYTRYYSSVPLFDHEEVWGAIVTMVRKLRQEVRSPIVAMPTMYEETRFEGVRNQARIIGLVPNSPAQRAGLSPGDLIVAVGAVAVRNRPQARDLLALARAHGKPFPMVVRRGEKDLVVTIDPQDYGYPYDPHVDRHLGVITMGMGFRTRYVEALRDLIQERGARHVLFLSSRLVRPYFEDALREVGLIDATMVRLDIEVPENRYFGGNIILGDLLVVQDFIDHIRDYLARGNPRPDLVVIPSTPFGLGAWRRDLTGRPYMDIERATGVPVALLECERIYE